MNDIVDIKTGKAISEPPKKSRQKTGQDAKRWKRLLEKLYAKELVLSIGEVDLIESGYLDATIDQIDDDIKDAVREKRSAAEHKRRGALK